MTKPVCGEIWQNGERRVRITNMSMERVSYKAVGGKTDGRKASSDIARFLAKYERAPIPVSPIPAPACERSPAPRRAQVPPTRTALCRFPRSDGWVVCSLSPREKGDFSLKVQYHENDGRRGRALFFTNGELAALQMAAERVQDCNQKVVNAPSQHRGDPLTHAPFAALLSMSNGV